MYVTSICIDMIPYFASVLVQKIPNLLYSWHYYNHFLCLPVPEGWFLLTQYVHDNLQHTGTKTLKCKIIPTEGSYYSQIRGQNTLYMP